jgi:membrane-anchored protein YejM (alkaline phosphatase superfamily)
VYIQIYLYTYIKIHKKIFIYKLPSTTRNFLSAIGLLDPFEETDNNGDDNDNNNEDKDDDYFE